MFNDYPLLLVSSNPEEGAAVIHALEKQQFTCDLAQDGEEALRMFNSKPYDMVVTDLQLPKRHGHSLAVDLLSRSNPPQVVVLTHLIDSRLARDLLARGVADIIHKPVPYDLFATKVLSLFEKEAWRKGVQSAANNPSPLNRTQAIQEIEKEIAELSECFENRLAEMFEFDGQLPDPPQAMVEFARRLDEEEEAEVESNDTELPRGSTRGAKRILLQATATAIPVSNQFQKQGDPFKLMLTNVGMSGVRMHGTRSTNSEFLAISWKAETIPYHTFRVVIQVTRCRPCKRFYEIGGQFVLADA